MLDAAIEKVTNSNDRPVVHSDRGAHYRWPGWLSRIRNAKLIRSMSRKGCSPDNAACEGFFGRLKTELFYPRNWQATTIDLGRRLFSSRPYVLHTPSVRCALVVTYIGSYNIQ
jgi:putative transposase